MQKAKAKILMFAVAFLLYKSQGKNKKLPVFTVSRGRISLEVKV
jgi:hypothetical protein